MTYLELYEQADYDLEHNLITIGEYTERLKPLDEEVRHTGHWIDKGSLSCRCSECGCKSNKETRFCANCGAKMEGENNGNS